jgi:hypothetical protein
MTPAQTLTTLEAIYNRCNLSGDADYVAAVTTIPFVFPNITEFESGVSDYWAFVNSANDTQIEIETEPVVALWINDIQNTMEDLERVKDSPLKQKRFELTLFTQLFFQRYNENATLNTFQRLLNKSNADHDFTREALQTAFDGTNELGLDDSIFATAETISLVEIGETERKVNCPFITDEKLFGSLTKFEVIANIQLVAC